MNTYLPPDDRTDNIDELIRTLNDIESILDNNQFDDVIWGSDMNWHKNRGTPMLKPWKDFSQNWGSSQFGTTLIAITLMYIPTIKV